MSQPESRKPLRLVQGHWASELAGGLHLNRTNVRVVCPFIKRRAAQRLLARGAPRELLVITRLNLNDFTNGVSDTGALRLLLEHGARIRGMRHLHAKLYLFGSKRAIVTSANLTEAALMRNHELGCVIQGPAEVRACHVYFDQLWAVAGSDLTTRRLDDIERRVNSHLVRSTGAQPDDLGDEGVVVPGDDVTVQEAPPWSEEPVQSLAKFFGTSRNRAPRSMQVRDELERSGSHWAFTYPRNVRPRRVRDGAVLFAGRMVRDPNDILIFGRAIGMRYVAGRDDASRADIARRSWKSEWPHYIRVHHVEFLAGQLGHGISLNALMTDLGADAFASTQRNARAGVGNREPRRAYMRKADVELSLEGHEWMNSRLQTAFNRHRTLGRDSLADLDWPPVPVP